MKKRLIVLLTGVMALGLAACGSKGTDSGAAASSAAAEASVSAEEEAGSAEGSAQEESAAEESGSAAEGSAQEESAAAESSAEEAGSTDYGYVIPAFDTTDIYGDAISSDIFAEKDVTMINCWGTFCGPCISEMPDLQKLSEQLPENAQLIGILVDVAQFDDTNLGAAVDIAENAGVTFRNAILDEGLYNELSPQIQYIPMTFFVDSKGDLLCEPIVGASMDEYVAQLGKLLDGWTYEA